MKILTVVLTLWVTGALAGREENHGEVSEAEVDFQEEQLVQEVLAEEGEEADDIQLVLGNDDDVEEGGDECSRISPKEVFHTELHPRLLKNMDEMSHYVEAVVERVEAAVEVLLPHVSHSPIGELNSQELFAELSDFMQGTIREAYELVRTAWRDLIRAHARGNLDREETLRALALIRDAQHQGDRYLNAALQELSVTIKAIVMNSIYVVHRSLNLPNGTEEHDVAKAIHKNLPKVAPNFLGSLMTKVLERGSDPSAYKKILTDPLRDLNDAVDKMYSTLETFIENGNDEDMAAYWREIVSLSHQRMRDEPLLEENFDLIYLNETYLTELTLSLMATW
ncbi:uncharacterized protein LOC122249421 [Penaeus japonicus]|uniref:uncharacterized protein LOC122249421 n=1 Tax=Penaeus japonicus TaxID=27405 RepID=UPI001C711836|nr:uncharacterized protein LOC122249421 [Penaeus japonicus]